MTVRTFVIVGALTPASVGLALAKSYDIQLLAPTKAGSVELKPGEYKLKIEGSQAVFTDVRSGKSFSVPVKIENSDKRFTGTQMETVNQNGVDTIQVIDLGDSHTRLSLVQ